MDCRLLMMGDAAFTLEYSGLRGTEGAGQVRALRSRVEQAIAADQITGISDMVSTSRSLTVCLSPASPHFERVSNSVLQLAKQKAGVEQAQPRCWRLPICYQGEYGLDLDEIARRADLTSAEVVELHSSRTYSVLMIGFLPGFPFMAEIDDRLRFPRRDSPRTKVPAGSLAIANDQTAIYPWESPGGWHLLGRCPIPLFNATWEQPSLLNAGERVTFNPINAKEFALIEHDLASGATQANNFLEAES